MEKNIFGLSIKSRRLYRFFLYINLFHENMREVGEGRLLGQNMMNFPPNLCQMNDFISAHVPLTAV